MINRSSWIQLGDMPAHLVREDTNKRVEIVHSAGQATLGEIDADLAMLEAISLTNCCSPSIIGRDHHRGFVCS